MDEAPHLFDLLLLDEARWIEYLDLAGNPAIEQRRVEGFDLGDAAAALQQGLPGFCGGVADRGQQTDAGDYDSAGNNVLLLRLVETADKLFCLAAHSPAHVSSFRCRGPAASCMVPGAAREDYDFFLLSM